MQHYSDRQLDEARALLRKPPPNRPRAIAGPFALVTLRTLRGFLSGPGSKARRQSYQGVLAKAMWDRLVDKVADDLSWLEPQEAELISRLIKEGWDKNGGDEKQKS